MQHESVQWRPSTSCSSCHHAAAAHAWLCGLGLCGLRRWTERRRAPCSCACTPSMAATTSWKSLRCVGRSCLLQLAISRYHRSTLGCGLLDRNFWACWPELPVLLAAAHSHAIPGTALAWSAPRFFACGCSQLEASMHGSEGWKLGAHALKVEG